MSKIKQHFNNSRVLALYKVGAQKGLLVQKLFKILIDTVPEKIVEIEEGLKSGDWDILVRNPHSLKSSFANLGIDSMMEKWYELEQLAKLQDNTAYTQLFSETKNECDLYLQELRSADADFESWITTLGINIAL